MASIRRNRRRRRQPGSGRGESVFRFSVSDPKKKTFTIEITESTEQKKNRRYCQENL